MVTACHCTDVSVATYSLNIIKSRFICICSFLSVDAFVQSTVQWQEIILNFCKIKKSWDKNTFVKIDIDKCIFSKILLFRPFPAKEMCDYDQKITDQPTAP